MRTSSLACIAATASILTLPAAFSGTAHAQAASETAPLPPTYAWQSYTPDGKDAAAFDVRNDGEIAVTARTAVSFLYRKAGTDAAVATHLTWRWRVDAAPEPTDLRKNGMDDRPLAVHLWFPKSESNRSFLDSLKSALGFPVVGRVITYVWGGQTDRGDMFPTPQADNAMQIVLRGPASDTGTWVEEKVDIRADYIRAFGTPPEAPPHFIAVSTDTDDMGGEAEGRVRGLKFISPTGQPVGPNSRPKDG